MSAGKAPLWRHPWPLSFAHPNLVKNWWNVKFWFWPFSVRQAIQPVAEAVFCQSLFGGYLFRPILLSKEKSSYTNTHTQTHTWKGQITMPSSHFDHKQLTVERGHDACGCAHFCVCVRACVSVSDQEGGRWRSVSRRGPRGGAAVRGRGGLLMRERMVEMGQSFTLYVCLSVCIWGCGWGSGLFILPLKDRKMEKDWDEWKVEG